MTPAYWPDATHDLASRDAVLRTLIGKLNALVVGSRGDAFSTLARSIVGQQISVKAAQSVWTRLCGEFQAVTPLSIRRARTGRLRRCGLSERKAGYLRDLAAEFFSGAIDIKKWQLLDDDALIAELTRMRGIGRWTAEMFLIFYMMRPNVLPLDDIGLQRAIARHYNGGQPLSTHRIRTIGNSWAPWRSVGTWYMWRSLDTPASPSRDIR